MDECVSLSVLDVLASTCVISAMICVVVHRIYLLCNRDCVKARNVRVDIAEQNHTCHRCVAIPTESTFAAKVRRAAMSQLRDAVQQGERNLTQAGVHTHGMMTLW